MAPQRAFKGVKDPQLSSTHCVANLTMFKTHVGGIPRILSRPQNVGTPQGSFLEEDWFPQVLIYTAYDVYELMSLLPKLKKIWLLYNALAAFDFDMQFWFILSGWDGSAYDSRILKDAIDVNPRALKRLKDLS